MENAIASSSSEDFNPHITLKTDDFKNIDGIARRVSQLVRLASVDTNL